MMPEAPARNDDRGAAPYYWDLYATTTVGRYLLEREVAFVRRCLHPVRTPATVLDIGCGSGRLSRPLRDLGFRVVGVDSSRLALRAFRRGGADRCALVEGDAHRLPFPDGSMAHVVSMQSSMYLEHGAFLSECHRTLRTGGRLLFNALNRHSYKAPARRWRHGAGGPSGGRLSTPELIDALLAAGFDVDAIVGYNWIPFSRVSDSGWVDLTARGERLLGLERLARWSPWLLVAATRRRG